MKHALLSLLVFCSSFSAFAYDSLPNDQQRLACLSQDINLILRKSATILIVENPMDQASQAPLMTVINVDTTNGFPAAFRGLTEYRNMTLERRFFGKFVLAALDADGDRELSLTFKPAYGREFKAVLRAGFEREVLNCKFD